MIRAALLLLLALAAPVAAQTPVANRVAARLAEAGPGPRFGLVVLDEAGREIVAIRPDERFIPASNTKIAITATAYATLGDLTRPQPGGGTRVRMEGEDVVIEGRGDPFLSVAPDCISDCLSALADAVAARTRRVRDIIGDARWFPDERWPSGMSWNNIPSRSGTAIAALTLDDNETVLTIRPGPPGGLALVDHNGWYAIDNRIVTAAEGAADIGYDRPVHGRTLTLTGTIAADAPPRLLRLGIDDPAEYAAWTFRRLLAERGVRVTGDVRSRYRSVEAAAAADTPPLAALDLSPLAQDIGVILKDSQNHHADLLLRRIGRIGGTGSVADGLAVVKSTLAAAGVPPHAAHFADGSGMSTYNRMTPRGNATLLRWIDAQPWGQAWFAGLPVGGTDGTLKGRFAGTALDRRIFAKTGSLNATSALSGVMLTRSGRRLIFSAFANDVPDDVSGTAILDAALVDLAGAL
ncbi:D-alanyl-D-alanine carboxypeptidase/D-alanyl-D-alanine-endopeptidase [Sphingomonas sp. BGYR3]|uniref:D-alanyl-D-alanine carboxypeptidase/D-alanyl-D-alanine endopeptidase n=1 Tax=Sphingomonas sp. BGYR3 TaxID=2975483 RepID=UPI0021A7877E|nr:D-alanyl-D-alanine carboxypeptidase/D-alanyl-D-alanine-endopeptidase [Sphingomonas sp. BGYR3]MDG5489049.1 D-alanyl-D-alanine carboxypeptidase/D-alanyl-D-alanine-endopeptidase [Sphingomonas sp. BGYR3]